MIQQQLKSSQVVKAFNHIGYHNLLDLAAPVGSSGRKSVALAGDQLAAKCQVATIINQMGFDPLDIGPLAAGKLLEPGSPAFGASVSRTKLQFLIQKYAVDSKTD